MEDREVDSEISRTMRLISLIARLDKVYSNEELWLDLL